MPINEKSMDVLNKIYQSLKACYRISNDSGAILEALKAAYFVGVCDKSESNLLAIGKGGKK